jgi:hypothetical protein
MPAEGGKGNPDLHATFALLRTVGNLGSRATPAARRWRNGPIAAIDTTGEHPDATAAPKLEAVRLG